MKNEKMIKKNTQHKSIRIGKLLIKYKYIINDAIKIQTNKQSVFYKINRIAKQLGKFHFTIMCDRIFE